MEGDFNMDLFISLVKAKENIWNYKKPGYNDRQQRCNAWLSICKEMIPNFEEKTKAEQSDLLLELQNKWKVLRDGFLRSYKNLIKKCASTQPLIKKYTYYDELLFLKGLHDFKFKHQIEEVSGARTSNSSIVNEDAPVEKKKRKILKRTAKESSSEETETITDTHETEEMPAETRKRKKQTQLVPKKPTSEEILIEKLTQRASERLHNDTKTTSDIDHDNDKLFLMSLLKDFSSIPEVHKLDAKFDIINVLRHYRNISGSSQFETGADRSSHAVDWMNPKISVGADTELPVSTTVAVVRERSQSQNSTHYVKCEDYESDGD